MTYTKDQVRSTEEALKLALEALEVANSLIDGYYLPKEKAWLPEIEEAITAIKQALAAPVQSAERGEPVTILPDGSAFGMMSFPLPADHWLYAPNEYRDGEYEPIDLPKPILTHALREAVVAAVRYAVRGATMRGQEMDFDPDALVQNAVYALCGPYTTPPVAPRQWVGLTDDEFLYCVELENHVAIAEEVEAKLKEKNNG